MDALTPWIMLLVSATMPLIFSEENDGIMRTSSGPSVKVNSANGGSSMDTETGSVEKDGEAVDASQKPTVMFVMDVTADRFAYRMMKPVRLKDGTSMGSGMPSDAAGMSLILGISIPTDAELSLTVWTADAYWAVEVRTHPVK